MKKAEGVSQFDLAGISCQICRFSAFYNQRGVREAQFTKKGEADLDTPAPVGDT